MDNYVEFTKDSSKSWHSGRGIWGMIRYKAAFAAVCIFASIALAGCATQRQSTIEKLSSADKAVGTRILIMPVDVELYELGAGGLATPKAEWTSSARQYLANAFHEAYAQRKVKVVDLDESKVPEKSLDDVRQLVKLHGAVGTSMLVHEFNQAGKLPSKSSFDWSLGPSARLLREEFGADYAVFVYVRDSYSSGGRVAMQVVGALLGVGIQGGTQVGFVSLVDLNTGNVVWFNRLARGTGDLRSAQAASETTNVMLTGFPQ